MVICMSLKRMAKAALAVYGVKMYQKDMKKVTLIKKNIQDHFAHVRIYEIRTNDDRLYRLTQETVDENNKFSMNSARYITKEFKEVYL